MKAPTHKDIIKSMQALAKKGMATIVSPEVQNRHRNIVFPATAALLKQYSATAFKDIINDQRNVKRLEDQGNFKAVTPGHTEEFTSGSYTSRDAYDNFAIRIADGVSDMELHEIVGILLLNEKERVAGSDAGVFLRNNSLAKSFLQIQISRHIADGLLPKILKDHFVTNLKMDAKSKSITGLGVSLGCPELASAFTGLDAAGNVEENELSTEIRKFEVTPLPQEEKKAHPAPKKRSVCGVLVGTLLKASCAFVCTGVAAMAFECLTKVSLGLTSALSSSLQASSLSQYVYAYNMGASTALHSMSLWLIDPFKQEERAAASVAVLAIGVSAALALKCCGSRSNAQSNERAPQ